MRFSGTASRSTFEAYPWIQHLQGVCMHAYIFASSRRSVKFNSPESTFFFTSSEAIAVKCLDSLGESNRTPAYDSDLDHSLNESSFEKIFFFSSSVALAIN